MIPDHALEANRRAAWARFYEARRDLARLQLWAAELAEWIDALEGDGVEYLSLPAVLSDLIDTVRAGTPPGDLARIRTFIDYHLAAAS